MYIYLHTPTYIHINTYTYTHKTQTYAYKHTHIYTYIHSYAHTYIHSYANTYMHILVPPHTLHYSNMCPPTPHPLTILCPHTPQTYSSKKSISVPMFIPTRSTKWTYEHGLNVFQSCCYCEQTYHPEWKVKYFTGNLFIRRLSQINLDDRVWFLWPLCGVIAPDWCWETEQTRTDVL